MIKVIKRNGIPIKLDFFITHKGCTINRVVRSLKRDRLLSFFSEYSIETESLTTKQIYIYIYTYTFYYYLSAGGKIAPL